MGEVPTFMWASPSGYSYCFLSLFFFFSSAKLVTQGTCQAMAQCPISFNSGILSLKATGWAGAMDQLWRALTSLEENLGSVPSTNVG